MCRYSNKPGNHEYVWSFRNLKQEQVQIRFNLVVAIAIAQIVFLSGIDASEIRVSNDNTLFHPTYHFSCYLRLRSVACVKTSLRSNIYIKLFSPACSLSLKPNSFSFGRKVLHNGYLWNRDTSPYQNGRMFTSPPPLQFLFIFAQGSSELRNLFFFFLKPCFLELFYSCLKSSR